MRFPMCTLSGVVTPGMYVVMTSDKKHVSEVQRLEHCMTEEMSNIDSCDIQLSPEMTVAVRYVQGKFSRGIIESKISDDLYEVMLVDYGHMISVEKSEIRVITNERFTEVEPLAFLVKLYGLIPARYVVCGGVRVPKACKNWRSEAHQFVKCFFHESHKVVVQSILIQQRVVYGDLFIKDESKMKYISLRKLLCKNEFCAYSESIFLDHEGLNAPSVNSEMEAKMELVKKWQQENFGEFKKAAYQMPLAVIPPRATDSEVAYVSPSGSEPSDRDHSRPFRRAETSTSCSGSGKPSEIGLGRGKLKLLIAEMKRKEEAASPSLLRSPSPGALRSHSSDEVVGRSRASCGRGQFLRRFLRAKGPAAPQGGSRGSAGLCSAASTQEGRPPFASQVERAVVKPGEFSEFSDSNGFSEVSLSSEPDAGPPPLVRNAAKNNQLTCSEAVEEEGRVEEEVKKFGGTRTSVEKRECDESEKVEDGVAVECSAAGGKETSGRGGGQPEWKHRSNLVAASNCWTPFVLFDDTVVEPVGTFRELPIQQSIIKNLEKGGTFGSLSQVQRWAIPAIRKQHNTVVIGSAKSGKTLSYLIPIADYVQDECNFEELPRGNGPSVVVLASSSRVCESIYFLCRSLLGLLGREEATGKAKVKVALAHGGGREEEMWVTLTNGCDILVTTPPCLVRLLEFPVITNLERLTCLVLDEAEVVSADPLRKHLRVVLEKAELSTKGRHFQRILCGERWTGEVESIVKAYVGSYALVIGSYLEAVIYEKLTPGICLVEKERKAEVLVEKLRECGDAKVVVFCEASEEVIFLKGFLSERGISALGAHEKVLAERLKEAEAVWKNSRQCVVIMVDGVLSELDVREAQVLIHYGLPSKSKTNFFLRHMTVLHSYEKRRRFRRVEEQRRASEVRVVVLLDEENHWQLPHMAELVARLGGKVPEEVVERCEEIRRVLEVSKSRAPVCEGLLAFGRCRKPRACPRRHALVRAWDAPEQLPRSGWVSFVVVRSLDAALVAARLVEHVEGDGKRRRWEDRSEEMRARVEEFYGEEGRRRPVGGVRVGDVCGVRSSVGGEEVFQRGRVVEVLRVDRYETALEVGVKLLDEGGVCRRKVQELYELGEELAGARATAVDVRVVGVQPLDFDVRWSRVARVFGRNLMTQKLEEDQYWSGRVVLAIGNTLFLESVKRQRYLPHLKVHAFDLVVREELLSNRIAVANPEHLPLLRKLCAEAGLELPGEEEVMREDSAKVEPQWAFFDADEVKVRFLAAENTSTVFLQPKKYEKLLEALEEDCQEEGAAAEAQAEAGKESGAAAVGVGMYCLARSEDGKWNRARVESESEGRLCVYFVDHGDFLLVEREDVAPISQRLLLRLPCQAVECSLTGIQHEEECPRDVLQRMYAFSEDGERDLYAHVVSRDVRAQVTHGRKYGVNLVSREGISLNKLLVDEGTVRALEEERSHLEDKEAQQSGGETEDGEEDGEEGGEEGGEEWGEGAGERREEEEVLQETEVAERRPPGEDSLGTYLERLRDDVFEDEKAQEFLTQLTESLFPRVDGLVEMQDEGEILPKGKPSQQRIRRLLDLKRRRRSARRGGSELQGREGVLTPQVLWSQTQGEVRLRVLLGNVSSYSVECGDRNLSLRCLQGQKVYAVDVRLFGAVSPRLTRVAARAFDVCVVLAKLASPPWPRLHLDEGKHRWVGVDAEGLAEERFLGSVESAAREVEAGQLKEGLREGSVEECSDLEGSAGEELYSDSEVSDDDF